MGWQRPPLGKFLGKFWENQARSRATALCLPWENCFVIYFAAFSLPKERPPEILIESHLDLYDIQESSIFLGTH